MRVEFVIAGCILVVVGLILASVGYEKVEPTPLENVVTFVEKLSGQKAPDELRSSKRNGYIVLTLGGVCVIGGLGLILRSRAAK